MIVADDLGWADLGCFGSSFYESPNLDKLAEDGIKFTNGYASCPVCSPTRASIQTGKYSVKSGITDWIPGRVRGSGTTVKDRWMNLPTVNNLNVNETTIADVLKENGYKTFFAGKWHLGETAEYWPENQGYDINKGGYFRGSPYRNREAGTNGYFSPYGNPRLEDGPVDEYLPERLANETISFIKAQDEQPFFVCLAFYLVHTPLQAKEEEIFKYTEKRIQCNIDTLNEINSSPDWADWATVSRYKERRIQGLPVYASMVHALDENIGHVIEALKEKDFYDNTVIIFTSDNGGLSTAEGWPTSNAPLRAGKGWLYEGGIRVPWIIKVPNSAQAGSVETIPVSSIDIMPTVLSLAGINEENQDIDGLDLTGYIGNTLKPTRPLYWHYPHYSNQGGNPGSVIRLGKYKMVHDFERGTKELYNLQVDIGETMDISKENQELADSLYQLLDQWRIENNAVMMTDPNPNWDGLEPIVQ